MVLWGKKNRSMDHPATHLSIKPEDFFELTRKRREQMLAVSERGTNKGRGSHIAWT